MIEEVSLREFREAEGAEDWRIVADGAAAFFRTDSLAASARFVQAIAELPGIEEHRPDLDVRQDGVTARLVTIASNYYGLTRRDLEVARQVSGVARGLGLASDPAVVQSVLVVPGAANTADVMPFWEAVLGYERRPDTPDEDLIDPRGRGPAFWFEQMEELRRDGGGAIHIAVWLAPEVAEARVAAALAAGGRIVRDTFAPAWWTLADAAGNEADISTAVARD